MAVVCSSISQSIRELAYLEGALRKDMQELRAGRSAGLALAAGGGAAEREQHLKAITQTSTRIKAARSALEAIQQQYGCG
jgi:hypothetical protein